MNNGCSLRLRRFSYGGELAFLAIPSIITSMPVTKVSHRGKAERHGVRSREPFLASAHGRQLTDEAVTPVARDRLRFGRESRSWLIRMAFFLTPERAAP
jgi:hypothetical protein